MPFFIRTGKRLPITQTELRLVFRRPPKLGVQRLGHRDPEPDQLVVRLDPSAGVRIQLDARAAEDDEPQASTSTGCSAGRVTPRRRRTRCCCTPR